MKKPILLLLTMALISVAYAAEEKKMSSKKTNLQVIPCVGKTCEVPPINKSKKESHQVRKRATTIKPDRKPKQLWAKSFLWAKAPKIIAEKWIGKAPDLTKNKIIILEFWNTWCPPCRRSLPKLTEFQEKFKDDIIVIALTSDSEAEILGLEKKYGVKLPNCYIASSPKKETLTEFGIRGVPHAVVIEPENGCVIWEGFPQQKGYELTDKILQKVVEIGKQ